MKDKIIIIITAIILLGIIWGTDRYDQWYWEQQEDVCPVCHYQGYMNTFCPHCGEKR